MTTSPLAAAPHERPSPALSDDRRHEIATFLRTRRARLRPEQVGLPAGVRRRTPGLRREEVAALAAVSTEWYKWLEQAREVRASEEALRRISAALRLEPGEMQHLLTLSGYGLAGAAGRHARAPIGPPVGPHVQRVLDELEPCPAWVAGERWDFLAWNRAATVIWGELGALEGIARNSLYQLFLNPRMRATLVEWELHARDVVAKVRLAHARNVDDPWFNEPIQLLRTRSAEFAAWWEAHQVQLPRDGVKRYDHPTAGRLAFDYTSLAIADERGAALQLTLYLPTADTRAKVDAILTPTGDAAGTV